MPNRLAGETSPYLLQHAHNPVDWYPWGREALSRAKAENRPIFLSIGYAACHWCHVMERESFEDEETARQLNEHFVPIKVDREERPDLDQVYMAAVQAMTGGGGWPMSVFLTPDGAPFYGGTYFPNAPRHGMPAFRQVLEGIQKAWTEQRPEVEASAARLVETLRARSLSNGDSEAPAPPEVDGQPLAVRVPGPSLPDRSALEAAVARLESEFDARRGGWGGAPKFPQPMTIEFLLRRAADGDRRALAMARLTLDRMADGGIHDQLGGGFHRYSTDARWLVPHFEQMLYDNAQLARTYLHAWALTGAERYLDVAESVLDYLVRRLRRPDGAFAASEDADTDGEEGGTFVWTQDEVIGALGSEQGGLFAAAYGVTPNGNWEGRTILSRVAAADELAGRAGISADEVEGRLAAARERLLEHRDRRPQPARDDKALCAWNGLAIAAFAEAVWLVGGRTDAVSLGRSASWRQVAIGAADAILSGLVLDGRLRRSWKDGRATGAGVLEDYTHLAEGLLALYRATFDEQYFRKACDLMDVVLERFADPRGGFFDTADDHEMLVARPKDLQDNAIPSGNAMATTVLLTLASLTGEGRYRDAAEAALRAVGGYLARFPSAFAQWLVALDLAWAGAVEVAIVGDPSEDATARLLRPARVGFHPHQVVAVGADPASSAVPLLQGRFALGSRPTAFVCRDFACRQPVTEPEALAALLIAER